MEAEIYPARAPEKSTWIDGNLGDGSQFHATYGYYAHGIGPETARAPAGWRDRLVRVEIPPRPLSDRTPVAYFLEPHDLVLSKCAAGRDRDWDYARAAVVNGLVSIDELLARLPLLPVEERRREHIRTLLFALAT